MIFKLIFVTSLILFNTFVLFNTLPKDKNTLFLEQILNFIIIFPLKNQINKLK